MGRHLIWGILAVLSAAGPARYTRPARIRPAAPGPRGATMSGIPASASYRRLLLVVDLTDDSRTRGARAKSLAAATGAELSRRRLEKSYPATWDPVFGPPRQDGVTLFAGDDRFELSWIEPQGGRDE